MKAKFTCLEPGDTVWVVYNENYKELDYTKPYREVLKPATVLQNKKITVERSSSDIYDDTTWTEIENYIEIETDIQKYSRDYDDYYDNRPKMTMTSGVWSNGPTILVFVNKKDAIEYLETMCQYKINRLKEDIANCQKQIELCEQSIINAKKDYE